MTIAREEILDGPLLIPYETEEEAVRIANDTPYGLAAYVQGSSQDRTQSRAPMRAGMVHNGAPAAGSPFGGYKQSGIGVKAARSGSKISLS